MEPFLVTCETCRARLKVRDERVLGQIHECPKCGSMVQIAHPTSVAMAAVAAVPTVDVALVPPTPISAPVAVPVSPVAALAEPSLTAQLAHVARQHGWLALAGGMSLVVLGGLIAALLNSDPTEIATREYPSVVQTVATADEAPNQSATDDTVSGAIAASTTPAVSSASEMSPANPRDNELNALNDGTSIPPETIATSHAVSPTPAESNAANAVASAQPSEPRKMTLDPVASTTPPTGIRPPSIASNFPSPPYSPEEAAVEEPVVKPQATATRVVDTGRERAATNVSAQLALPIRSMDLPEMPLGDFARIISEMGAVPVAIEAEAFTASSATAPSKVTVHARDTTLGDLLSDALKPLGLAWVERDGKVVVVRAAR